MSTTQSDITITATCFADATTAIDLGVAIATAGTHLQAIMLVESARAQRVDVPERSPGDANAIAFGEAIERDARLFQSSFEVAVRKLDPAFSFGKLTEDMDTFFATHVGDSGFLVVGFEPLHRLVGNVVVLAGSPKAAERLKPLATKIALPRNLAVSEFLVADAPNPGWTRAGRILTSSEVLSMLGKTSAKTVVVGANVARKLGLRKLLYAARCPLVIELDRS